MVLSVSTFRWADVLCFCSESGVRYEGYPSWLCKGHVHVLSDNEAYEMSFDDGGWLRIAKCSQTANSYNT